MIAAVASALATAAGTAGEPVVVPASTVPLVARDRAAVPVLCRRQGGCDGQLVLGIGCTNEPVVTRACQQPVGSARFRLRRGERRDVVVARLPGDVLTGAGPNQIRVSATPFLARRPRIRLARRSRSVALVSLPGLERPAPPLTVSAHRVVDRDDPRLRVSILAPLGTTRATMEISGQTVALHADGDAPYAVPRDAFAVSAVRMHGETTGGDDEHVVGGTLPYRVEHCRDEVCAVEEGGVIVGEDPSRINRPICRLHPLPAAV